MNTNSQASKDSDSAPLIASPERRPSGADASAADGYHNDASSPAYGSDSFHSPQPLLSPHPDAHQQGAPTPVTSAAYFPPSYGSGGNAPQLPAPPPTWGQSMAAARTTVVEQGDKTWLWSVLTAGVVVPTLLYRVCTGVLCPGEQTLMAWLVAGVSGSPVVSSWIPAVSKLCALHIASCSFVGVLSLLTLLWLLLGTALLLQSPMPSCESGTTMALTLAVAVLHWVGWTIHFVIRRLLVGAVNLLARCLVGLFRCCGLDLGTLCGRREGKGAPAWSVERPEL